MKSTPFPAMSTMVLFVSSLLLVTAKAGAQDNQPDNSLQEGVWAIQFQISDNLSLKAFQGFAIAGKKHLTNRSALRAGIGLNISVREEDNVTRYLLANEQLQSQDQSSNTQSIDVSAQYLIYPNPDADINVFFGAGPLIRFTRGDAVTEATTSSGKSKSVLNEYAWAIGASGLFGVEWFATKGLSLMAEYAISCEYSTANSTRTQSTPLSPDRTETERKTKDIRVYPLAVKFGLSVYF